jgi:glutamate dehydrogenase
MVSVHQRQVAALEKAGAFDRKLEALPSTAEFKALEKSGEGLTSPELATLMAHVKLDLKDRLVATDLPESEVFSRLLPSYFPKPLRERYRPAIFEHPLERQIITTLVANEVVDGAGISFVFRLNEEMNATANDAVRAYAVVSNAYDLPSLWTEINKLDNVVTTDVADAMMLETRRLLDRAARWFLTNRPQPLATLAEINRFGSIMADLAPKVGEMLHGREAEALQNQIDGYLANGVPLELAQRIAVLLHTYGLLDVTEVAELAEQQIGVDDVHSPQDTAELYYAVSDHLNVDKMLTSISALERGNRWHALARLSLRDDVYASLRAITLDALRHSEPGDSAQEKIAQWEKTNASRLSRARVALDEIDKSGRLDLATLSVAARQIRSTVR